MRPLPPPQLLERVRQPSSHDLIHLLKKNKILSKEQDEPRFNQSHWTKYIPIVEWLPYYNFKRNLWNDVVAAFVVAIMAIPQGMAYANLANMPPVYGLYSNVIPPILYGIFGTCRENSVGITAISSLITSSTLYSLAANTNQYIDLVVLATFTAGVLSVVMGILKMGYAVSFISQAAIAGFTTGSALTICVSQMEGLFGIKAEKANYSIVQAINVFKALPQTKWLALVNGFSNILVLYILKRFFKKVPGAVVVTAYSLLLGYLIDRFSSLKDLLPLVGTIPAGAPKPYFPTINASDFGTVIYTSVLLAIVGFLQSLAVTVKLAQTRNYEIRPSQELIALGLAKIGGSCFQSMDVTGSFGRTNVNAENGAKSLVSSFFLSFFILISLQYLTGICYFIPKSTLSAIVIMAVIGLMEFKSYLIMFKVKQRDFFVAFSTAVITFCVNAQTGLGVGIAISAILLLHQISKPKWAVLGEVHRMDETGHLIEDRIFRNVKRYIDAVEYPGILIFRFDANLCFVNARYFKDTLIKQCSQRTATINKKVNDGSPFDRKHSLYSVYQKLVPHREESCIEQQDQKDCIKFLILDFSGVNDIDLSGTETLIELIPLLEETFGIQVLLVGVKSQVRDVLWKKLGGIPHDPRAESSEQNIVQPVASSSEVDVVIEVPNITREIFFLSVAYAVDYCCLVQENGDSNESLVGNEGCTASNINQ